MLHKRFDALIQIFHHGIDRAAVGGLQGHGSAGNATSLELAQPAIPHRTVAKIAMHQHHAHQPLRSDIGLPGAMRGGGHPPRRVPETEPASQRCAPPSATPPAMHARPRWPLAALVPCCAAPHASSASARPVAAQPRRPSGPRPAMRSQPIAATSSCTTAAAPASYSPPHSARTRYSRSTPPPTQPSKPGRKRLGQAPVDPGWCDPQNQPQRKHASLCSTCRLQHA